MKRRWFAAIFLALVAVVLLGLWLARAMIAVQFARSYFSSHGVSSSVEIGELGFSGVSGRFALGPENAPEISADHIELRFDPLRWLPYVTEVRLVHPVVRVRVDESAKPSFGSLQDWIDSLSRQQGKSRFVSDDLVVSLTGLRALLATPAGALEVDGDMRLEKNLPIALTLQAVPARIAARGTDVVLRNARVAYDRKAGTLTAQFSGDVRKAAMDTRAVDARVSATGFRWISAGGRLSVTAPAMQLQASAASVAAGQVLSAPKLDVTARNVAITAANGKVDGAADLVVAAQAGLDAALTALRSADPTLANALRQNLAHL